MGRLLDQRRGSRALARGHGLAHGLVDEAMVAEPLPRDAVHRALFGLAALAQAPAQGFAQQRMQAVPGLALGAGLDRHDEQVLALQPREQRRRGGVVRGPAEQGRAQRRAETAAGRDADQQVEIGRRQVRQHFLFEIGGEGLRVLHVGAHEVARQLACTHAQFLAALLPVDGQQLQAGGPAVAQFVQRQCIARRDAAQLRLQEALGLGRRKAQVAHVDLQHLAFGAQAVERQRQRAARSHGQMQVARRVVQQPLQRLVQARVHEVLQVVEHQHQLARMGGNAAHQRDQRALHGFAVDAAAGVVGGFLGGDRRHLRHAGQQVVEQSRGLVVLGREAEPGDVEAQRQQRLSPRDQGGGLAAAGGALQHDAAAAAPFHQPGQQRLAGHGAPGAAGGNHLGGDQGLEPGGVGRTRGGKWLVLHVSGRHCGPPATRSG
ncbi:hypothetical protein D3C87_1229850 [compost metagenome]